VLAILRESFEGWHGDRGEAYWAWKFERNPHGAARIWVAEEEGQIAGCYVLTPTRVHLRGQTIMGAQSVDAAVHPDFRGRGVFTALARTAMEDATGEGLALTFAFPTEAAFHGQLKVGFRQEPEIAKAYRPLTPVLPGRQRHRGLVIRELERFDSRFDVFCRGGAPGESALSLWRDHEYLQWRHGEHPTRSYVTLACEERDELRGYCVLSVDPTPRRLSRGWVVDLQVLPGSEAAAACLVRHGLLRLRAFGARVGVTWARAGGLEWEALAAAGFSTRYESIRRALSRPRFGDQFIVFENDAGKLDELRSSVGAAPSLPWSLVPGDADYI